MFDCTEINQAVMINFIYSAGVSTTQNKTRHDRLHNSLSININKYCIVMNMAHRHHIRAEKEEWKTTLSANNIFMVKMINVMTGRKLIYICYLLQLISHILNLLTKLSLFLCISFYCFTVLWKHFRSELTVCSQVPILEGS